MEKINKLLMTFIISNGIFIAGNCGDGGSWSDNDRLLDAYSRESDKIFKDAQKSTGASEHEENADRKSWKPESDSKAADDSRTEDTRGTFGPPDRDK